MSLGKEDCLSLDISVKSCGEFSECFDEVDDDVLISEAYDLFVTQSTRNEEKHQPSEQEEATFHESINASGKIQERDVNFLEDELITLEDLRLAIIPNFNLSPGLPDLPEDDFFRIEDMSEASTIATITIIEIFGRSWEIIAMKQNSLEVATSTLLDIINRAWKIIKPRSRWRQPNPSTWKRNVAKKRRADGLPYVTTKKMRQAKVPKAKNCTSCKFKCSIKISAEDRDKLCRKYWGLDYTAKKNFILSLVQVLPIKTTVIARKRATQRSNNKKYYFKINGLELQVCQSFFCKTLCISPSVVTNAVAHRDSLGLYSKTCDPRGHHEPKNKTSLEQVQRVHDHITSFPAMESHYVRKCIKRKYLDSLLSIYKMYKLYEEECEKNGWSPVSEATYRKIFCNDFNLGFYVPKKDQCLVCTKYDRLNDEDKSKMEQEYQQHVQRKKVCNDEKQNDKRRAEKEENFLTASFDLQAILQIPSGDVGLLYYCRKLIVYNLTIYESAAPNDAYCFAWTEINGKKGSSEIGSIILQYLSQIPDHYNEVSLFSDTCGGQNRNQQVAAVLLWAVHKIEHIKVIEHKFLESGHSYMEVDSMHSSIESAKKYTNVYSMIEWLNIFRRARTSLKSKRLSKKPYIVNEMKYSDFKDLKMLSSSIFQNKTKTSDGRRMQWLKIKRMKYVKGESRIYYNYDMTENFFYIELDIQMDTQYDKSTREHRYSTRQNKRCRKDVDSTHSIEKIVGTTFPNQLNQLYKEPLPISVAKKADLLKLCRKGVIPEEYHGWFENIKTDCQSIDRVPDLTVSDTSDEE